MLCPNDGGTLEGSQIWSALQKGHVVCTTCWNVYSPEELRDIERLRRVKA